MLGVVAASVSSALASLVGAPRVLQAVCRDRLIPVLNFFGVGRAKDDEPIRCVVEGYLCCCMQLGGAGAEVLFLGAIRGRLALLTSNLLPSPAPRPPIYTWIYRRPL